MKIGAISSNNYISKRNVNVRKNYNPSFGEITNIAELKTIVDAEVKEGKVTRVFADQVIEKLKNIKFSIADGIEKYCKERIFLKDQHNFLALLQNSYYSVLKEKGLNPQDLPVKLKYSLIEPRNFLGYYGLQPCLQREKLIHYIRFERDFVHIEYNYDKSTFASIHGDKDKNINNIFSMYSEFPTFTEFLDNIIDNKCLEEEFYNEYVYNFCQHVPGKYHSDDTNQQDQLWTPGPL